jgi:excisionase family DNA binding protein
MIAQSPHPFDSGPTASDAARGLDAFDDHRLVALALQSDDAAIWILAARHAQALREAARDANGDLSPAEAAEVFRELWSSLMDHDMRQLREFDPSRGAAFLSWLTVRLTKLIGSRSAAPATANELPTLMRVEDVAKRWGIDRKTVYAMIERGQLVARRCGRLVRIPRKMVESFELQASVSPERTG